MNRGTRLIPLLAALALLIVALATRRQPAASKDLDRSSAQSPPAARPAPSRARTPTVNGPPPEQIVEDPEGVAELEAFLERFEAGEVDTSRVQGGVHAHELPEDAEVWIVGCGVQTRLGPGLAFDLPRPEVAPCRLAAVVLHADGRLEVGGSKPFTGAPINFLPGQNDLVVRGSPDRARTWDDVEARLQQQVMGWLESCDELEYEDKQCYEDLVQPAEELVGDFEAFRAHLATGDTGDPVEGSGG